MQSVDIMVPLCHSKPYQKDELLKTVIYASEILLNPFPNDILGIDKKHGRLTGPYSVEFGPYRMQHTLCNIGYVT